MNNMDKIMLEELNEELLNTLMRRELKGLRKEAKRNGEKARKRDRRNKEQSKNWAMAQWEA